MMPEKFKLFRLEFSAKKNLFGCFCVYFENILLIKSDERRKYTPSACYCTRT